jgi:hypothetical protein
MPDAELYIDFAHREVSDRVPLLTLTRQRQRQEIGNLGVMPQVI